MVTTHSVQSVTYTIPNGFNFENISLLGDLIESMVQSLEKNEYLGWLATGTPRGETTDIRKLFKCEKCSKA